VDIFYAISFVCSALGLPGSIYFTRALAIKGTNTGTQITNGTFENCGDAGAELITENIWQPGKYFLKTFGNQVNTYLSFDLTLWRYCH
jgi:hypothetical protein